MEIAEAIRITKGVAKQKRAFAATARAHPLADERYMRHITAQADREAKAMEAVCNKLTAILAEREVNADGD